MVTGAYQALCVKSPVRLLIKLYIYLDSVKARHLSKKQCTFKIRKKSKKIAEMYFLNHL